MSEYTAGQVERAAGSVRVRSSDELEVERMLCAYAAALRQQERCPYCDNTGDVHSIDGEWRGECHECKARHAERGDGAVSDEVVGAAWNAYEQSMSTRERFTQAYKRIAMRVAIEAAAPLLRAPAEHMEDARCPPTYRREEAVKTLIALGWAWDGKDWIAPTPAEQGGRVDFSEADGAALRSMKVGEALTEGQWESACQFVRHQDDIIRNLRAALAQNAHTLGDFVRLPDAERVVLGQQVAERVDEMENMRGEAVADRPAGFGIACTVTWTELHAAMTADGMTPPNKCGKAMSAWIGKVVRDYLRAERARVPAGYDRAWLTSLAQSLASGAHLLSTDWQQRGYKNAANLEAASAFIRAVLAAAPSQPEDADQ